MSAVTKAVEEAEYFIKKLEEEESKPSVYTYNLNAFLSRGRSITWIIKKQYSKCPNFSKWYCEKRIGALRCTLAGAVWYLL